MACKLATGAVLLCGLAAATPTSAVPGRIERHVVIIGDWRLAVSHDQFTGDVRCELRSRNRRAIYERGAVGFRFTSRWDVGDAVYRVDGGPPRPARDDLPELIRDGVPIDAGGMSNPSAGTVWIPVQRLTSANMIAIQPRPGHRQRTVHFRGLIGLLNLAKERGCASESRFVR